MLHDQWTHKTRGGEIGHQALGDRLSGRNLECWEVDHLVLIIGAHGKHLEYILSRNFDLVESERNIVTKSKKHCSQ